MGRLFKEVVYDLKDFIPRVTDVTQVRMSFRYQTEKIFTRIQPLLYYPLTNSILVWEGDEEVFMSFEKEKIEKFQKKALETVTEMLGTKPIMGRWEK